MENHFCFPVSGYEVSGFQTQMAFGVQTLWYIFFKTALRIQCSFKDEDEIHGSTRQENWFSRVDIYSFQSSQ
jgi:hypothetical protein